MNVLSLFSGVGGFDLGLERAGMTTVAQCEWDAKCQQVLARHWPDVPRWGDVSDVNGSDLPDCDLVAFGSPCQDLSVAGKRAGMVEGETRSGLFYEAIRIIKELQEDGRGPAWVVWENVVGALSSNGGRDFGAVLDSLADLGAVDIQWRVLDAQWFGVPQRRRRVFVVARLNVGDAGQPEVLPVGASVRRDPAPGSETGQEVAGTLGGGSGSRGWSADTERMTFVPARDVASCLRASSMNVDDNTAQDGHLVDNRPTVEVVGTFSQGAHPGGFNGQDAYTGHAIPVAFAENQRGDVYLSDYQQALTGGGGKPGQGYAAVLAFNGFNGIDMQPSTEVTPTVRAQHVGAPQVLAPTLTASARHNAMQPGFGGKDDAIAAVHAASLAVRRLTPRECERLMGWPDDWTRYAADGTEIADSHRYRMCGNGVASPVAEWVGRCILKAAS
jgi:DNA (cytosine-5)-methyltransferase 1